MPTSLLCERTPLRVLVGPGSGSALAEATTPGPLTEVELSGEDWVTTEPGILDSAALLAPKSGRTLVRLRDGGPKGAVLLEVTAESEKTGAASKTVKLPFESLYAEVAGQAVAFWVFYRPYVETDPRREAIVIDDFGQSITPGAGSNWKPSSGAPNFVMPPAGGWVFRGPGFLTGASVLAAEAGTTTLTFRDGGPRGKVLLTLNSTPGSPGATGGLDPPLPFQALWLGVAGSPTEINVSAWPEADAPDSVKASAAAAAKSWVGRTDAVDVREARRRLLLEQGARLLREALAFSPRSDAEAAKRTNWIIAAVKHSIWPAFIKEAVELVAQHTLSRVDGFIYWHPKHDCFKLVYQPDLAPAQLVETLLHETAHVALGQVQKCAGVPGFVIAADGSIDDTRLGSNLATKPHQALERWVAAWRPSVGLA